MLVNMFCPDLIRDVELLFHFSLKKVQRGQHYLLGAQNGMQTLLNKNSKIKMACKIKV